MSVWKIAGGVIIGNIVTALIMWAAISISLGRAREQAMFDETNRQYEQMLRRQELGNATTASPVAQ